MTYSPLTILVDMDDTIENLTEAWIRYAGRRCGEAVDPAAVTTWDPSLAFSRVTHEEMYALLEEDALYETVTPLPGAAGALKKLMEDGHRVFIVTASPHRVINAKLDIILARHFPFLSPKQVILTFDKSMIRGDVLIDDGPHNLEAFPGRGILFSCPHNRAYDAAAHGFLRADSWEELLPLLEAMASGTA